jgi:hypothetical protein
VLHGPEPAEAIADDEAAFALHGLRVTMMN